MSLCGNIAPQGQHRQSRPPFSGMGLAPSSCPTAAVGDAFPFYDKSETLFRLRTSHMYGSRLRIRDAAREGVMIDREAQPQGFDDSIHGMRRANRRPTHAVPG